MHVSETQYLSIYQSVSEGQRGRQGVRARGFFPFHVLRATQSDVNHLFTVSACKLDWGDMPYTAEDSTSQ